MHSYLIFWGCWYYSDKEIRIGDIRSHQQIVYIIEDRVLNILMYPGINKQRNKWNRMQMNTFEWLELCDWKGQILTLRGALGENLRLDDKTENQWRVSSRQMISWNWNFMMIKLRVESRMSWNIEGKGLKLRDIYHNPNIGLWSVTPSRATVNTKSRIWWPKRNSGELGYNDDSKMLG